MHARDVGRVAPHARKNLILGDRERHRPSGIEIDRGDVGGERRRRLVDLADNHPIPPLNLVVTDRFDKCGGNIHHHVAFGKDEIHPEQPLERRFELLEAVATGTLSARSVRASTLPVPSRP